MGGWMNGRASWDPQARERARQRQFEREQWERRGRELDRTIAENERRIAHAEGKLEALRDRALADPGVREAVRVALWARVPGRVEAEMRGGEAVLVAPDGLPEGVTEEDLDAAVLTRIGQLDLPL